MEYNKKNKKYSDRAQRAEACCKLGVPIGYYKMGMDEDDYKKMMKKGKNMKDYHEMNGYQMKGKKHHGPEGYWGIIPAN